MAAPIVRNLGDYIRDQRRSSQISLRQLARLAGVSNPYLSQIERGLRKPSAEILQQIAKALRISAEALYVQAGILEVREGSADVMDAILRDGGLTERQKQVLLEIYDSFRKENEARVLSAARAEAGEQRSPRGVEGRTSSDGEVVAALEAVVANPELAAELSSAGPRPAERAPAVARRGRPAARRRSAPATSTSVSSRGGGPASGAEEAVVNGTDVHRTEVAAETASTTRS